MSPAEVSKRLPNYILARLGLVGQTIAFCRLSRRAGTLVTYFGDTLKTVNGSIHQNVTLSLPEALLRRFRVYAASRNQSMTSLMAEAIREIMDRDADSVKAKRRFLERIERAPDRGTGGVIRWSREELHER
jgi:predicted transcriptional regulator